MSNQPLVTIIISTYNCVSKIAVTLDSLKKYPESSEIEIIVVDGGSSDGTLDLVLQYKRMISTVISEPDKGIYDAWNKGVDLAKGEWIIFLGAGDLLGEYWIEALKKAPQEAQFIYGDLSIYFEKDREIKRESRKWSDVKDSLCYEMSIPHVGAAHSKKLFYSESFDSNYKIIGDWEFLSRGHLKHGFYMEGVVQALMEMGDGISNDAANVKKQYLEIHHVFNARGEKMPVWMLCKWKLKLLISYFPSLYTFIQEKYWKYILANH